MNFETKNFIKKHLNDDVHTLSLSYKINNNVDLQLAIRQISGRQKVKNKIPFFYNNDEILYPPQLSIEQSSSELTAIYKSTLCEGEQFVDLTGGFGIDCYFISRNFKLATYIERKTDLCEIVKQNYKALDVANIEVINSECVDYLNNSGAVDVIYLDPARRNSSGNKVVFLTDCEPNIVQIQEKLLDKAPKVFIKMSPMLDISNALKDLPTTHEIHIISVDNECKEILFILNNEIEKSLLIKTINFQKNIQQKFDFSHIENNPTNVKFTSELYAYLYEPNSSVMKSGAFNLVATRFNLYKLHKNTHLYTSNEFFADFPGRIFRINSVTNSSKRVLNTLKQSISKANISVRNYPLNVNEFRKKTGIADGGDTYIFACKLLSEVNTIILCSKVT